MTAVVNPAGTMSPDSQSVAIALTTPSGPTLPYLLAVPCFLSGFSTPIVAFTTFENLAPCSTQLRYERNGSSRKRLDSHFIA
jgi:hypothetical protein